MRYLCLIYTDENAEAKKSPAEQQQLMADYYAFTNDVQKSGVYKAGEALHPTSSATTVRVRNGKALTTDGPFAETREQLGGFYLLDCKNLDEAIEWLPKSPTRKTAPSKSARS